MLALVLQGAEGEGFVPPSTKDFELPPIFGDNPYTTKPIFLVIFSVILISVFFIAASRKAAVVPSKLQFAGESVYAFVRNDLAKDVIGHELPSMAIFLIPTFSPLSTLITNNSESLIKESIFLSMLIFTL